MYEEGWYSSSKYCDLGPVGFPKSLPRVAARAVSFYGLSVLSPKTGLNYHLVHTAIPDKFQKAFE
jgi:hypothetical protein